MSYSDEITIDEAWDLWESGDITENNYYYNMSSEEAMAMVNVKMAHLLTEKYHYNDQYYHRHPNREVSHFNDKEFAYDCMETEALEDEAKELEYGLLWGHYISEDEARYYYEVIHFLEPEPVPEWKLLTDRLTELLGERL